MKTPENTEDDPEPADEGHNPYGILLWLIVKKLPLRNRSAWVTSDNVEYLLFQHLAFCM
jgi:hypothetical protein